MSAHFARLFRPYPSTLSLLFSITLFAAAAPGNAIAGGQLPTITVQPASVIVTLGQTPTFSIAATSASAFSYQWMRNGAAIPGATSSKYTALPVTAGDNGVYYSAKVTNAIGPSYSSWASVVIKQTPKLPVISTQPATTVVVSAGQAPSFVVAATSDTPVTYQWMHNGVVIAGATSASYTAPPASAADSGSYYFVRVSNAVGPAYSAWAKLVVTPAAATATTPTSTSKQPTGTSPTVTGSASATPTAPVPAPSPTTPVALPVIVTQPQASVVNGGQAVTFNVTATGATTYQWSRNGTAVAGANASTYTIPSVQLSDSGASFSVALTNTAGTTNSANARLTVNATPAGAATAARPFSDQSPWNSRPSKFALGTTQIPPSTYYPTVDGGTWSVKPALASQTDLPMTVYGPAGQPGIWIFDAETFATVTIPHWPATVTPATGADGHADIIDVAANKIHSFYQLKLVQGRWTATDYSWAPLNGSGWGTPAHYNVGARATGVPPTAGLIRTQELNDGLPAYRHALAMSLAPNALSSVTPYVFPATSADQYPFTGFISEGSLLMLPSDFDLTKIKDPRLVKIARTLQSYGAYAVDRNDGAPFGLYVEIGSNFSLMPSTGWDMEIAAELDLIRGALRQVVQVNEWVDANGAVFVPNKNLNLLSMRGGWFLRQGSTPGAFDSSSQSVIFPDNGQVTVQSNGSGNNLHKVPGTVPQAGQTFTLTVTATGGATLQMQIWLSDGRIFNTGALKDGTVLTFQWPTNSASSLPYVTVSSGPQGGGTVSATLIATGS